MESTTVKKQVKEIVLFALTKYWEILKTKVVQKTDIIDSLDSTSTDAPLSANQGKILKESITKGNTDIISDKFSEEKAYAAGEYTIYNNTIYKFSAAKVEGEWDPDVVTPTTVSDELHSLNGNITGILINILTSRTVTVIGNTVFNTTFSPEIPDGYEAIGVVGFNTGHDAFYCRSVSTTSMRGYSTTSDTRTVTQSIRILCIKTGSL